MIRIFPYYNILQILVFYQLTTLHMSYGVPLKQQLLAQLKDSMFQAINAQLKYRLSLTTAIRQDVFLLNKITINILLYDQYMVIRTCQSSIHSDQAQLYLKFDYYTSIKEICQANEDFQSKQIGFTLFHSNFKEILFQSLNCINLADLMQDFSKMVFLTGFSTVYKQINYIARGQSAIVYEVQSIKDKKRYAVKVFQKNVTFGQVNGQITLYNEIQILRKLQHPNLIKLQCVYTSQKKIYLVMNLIQGQMLNVFLKKHSDSLDINQKAKIMKSILKAVQYLHTINIVHHDLKLDNIIIDKNFNPYIVDFGLSQSVNKSAFLFQCCGSPGFIAPQMFYPKKEKVDIRKNDIFSLGSVFYSLLANELKFQASSVEQILEKNKNCQKTIKQKLKKLDSKSQIDILAKMLSIDPQKRITASQALQSQFFVQITHESFSEIRNCSSMSAQSASGNKFSVHRKNQNSKFEQLFSEQITTIQKIIFKDISAKINKSNNQTQSIENRQQFRTKRYFSEDIIDTDIGNQKEQTWNHFATIRNIHKILTNRFWTDQRTKIISVED